MRKFKVGDQVIITRLEYDRHKRFPQWYPLVGSVGTIVECEQDNDSALVQWGEESGTSDNHCWYCKVSNLRRITKADRKRALVYYARYVFPRALNDRDYYGSIFTSVSFAYKNPSEAKLQAEREIKDRMTAEGGKDYRVLYAGCQSFTTAYVAENILVIDTNCNTYRYDLEFCRNNYCARVTKLDAVQRKVDDALEVCRRG